MAEVSAQDEGKPFDAPCINNAQPWTLRLDLSTSRMRPSGLESECSSLSETSLSEAAESPSSDDDDPMKTEEVKKEKGASKTKGATQAVWDPDEVIDISDDNELGAASIDALGVVELLDNRGKDLIDLTENEEIHVVEPEVVQPSEDRIELMYVQCCKSRMFVRLSAKELSIAADDKAWCNDELLNYAAMYVLTPCKLQPTLTVN